MKRVALIFLMACIISTFFTLKGVYASDMPTTEELIKEIKELKTIIKQQSDRIDKLEKNICSQQENINKNSELLTRKESQDVSGHMRQEIERLKSIGGLEIGAGATFIGQGTPNANNANATDGEDSRFDGSYSVDIEIAKTFDDYGLAFIHMEAGQGDTVEGELNVFSNVNRDAGDSNAHVDITEAWYEQYIFDEQITITGGKIDATSYIDTNGYANDECTQFLGHIFRNSAVIDWPDDNNFGIRGNISPEFAEFIDIEGLYMEEDADWENMFDNPFIAAQINFMPSKAFGYDEGMWGGNYRIYMWYNGAPHPKVKNTDDFDRGNIGFGISCDQMITDVYGVFGRFGWADPVKSNLNYDWSLGAQMTGKYWNREDDIFAVAVGQAVPGDEYKDVNDFHENETHLEVYYSFKLNEHLTLTPDVQIIWEPNGGGTGTVKDSDTIFVYGLRGQIDL